MSVEVCECGHPRFDHGSIENDDFAGECFEGEEDWWCACLRYTPARCQYGRDCCEEMPGRVFCPCDGYTPAPPAGAREEDEGRCV